MSRPNASGPGATHAEAATEGSSTGKGSGGRIPELRTLTAYQLAALLDPDSLILHDVAQITCPRCRGHRACWPVGYGFRCDRCGLRQTQRRMVGMVLADPDAMDRYRTWYGLEVAS